MMLEGGRQFVFFLYSHSRKWRPAFFAQDEEDKDVTRGGWEDYDHSDQEMDVYEQCCGNCTNDHCPMMLPETAGEHYEEYGTLEDYDEEEARERAEEVMRLRGEDAISRDCDLVWCIYWEGRNTGY